MNPRRLASLICVMVTLWSGPCAAELLPGDIALTRIQGNVVSLMALRAIPSGEVIQFTDDFWVDGVFDSSGSGGSVTIPAGGLQPGDQFLVDLSLAGITLDWKDTLHFYQTFTPPFASQSHIRHLLLVELNEEGLRWWSNIPDGLTRDVTHIVIREQFPGQGMDHIIREELLAQTLTPYKWLSALGSFRAWSFSQSYETPIPIGQWPQVHLDVAPSPGMISLPFRAQNYSPTKGPIHIPVRRSFGSSGTAAVNVGVKDHYDPFERWKSETISGRHMDLTDMAYGPGAGFVAVSPNSGVILINASGTWSAVDTNDQPGENLQLSGIIHNGLDFIACSIDGQIYKSPDGKNWTWVHAANQPGAQFSRIHHLPQASFPYIAVGNNGLCALSADGANWFPSDTGVGVGLYGAAYFNGSYVLCGEDGVVIHTNDPVGTPWSTATTPSGRTLYSMAAVDGGGSAALLAVGANGEMLKSLSLANGFIPKSSNTNQSLYDVIETSRNNGADKYVLAVGANGVTVVSENGAPFTTRKLDRRAPALYALAQYQGGTEPLVVAAGEYGSLVQFVPFGNPLSGSVAGIDLNAQGSVLALTWGDGQSSEQYVTLDNTADLTQFRERILVELVRPAGPGSGYHLGNDQCEINFFRAEPAREPSVADNFGPLLNLTGAQLQVINDDQWDLSFQILNSSNRASQRLFIRFEGTNLPDLTIPASATAFTGSRIGPREASGLIQMPLRQPVESIALYEEFRPGEEVLKAQVAINCLVADTSWQPNGLFPRSLGVYLKDNGSLADPGIPGVDDLIIVTTDPLKELTQTEGEPEAEPMMATASGSGFVFSGTAPTPPDNNPESSELVLLSVDIGGPVGMDVRTSYDFFLVGSFYNTGTGLVEDYTMNTVDWEVTEASLPAVGLSILDDVGTFEATAYPGVQYTRTVSIDALTTEGAALDEFGDPIEYTDAQDLDINEPAGNRTYDEWVATNGLAAEDDGEDQDPDGDGIVNVLEFVLDLDPQTRNPLSGTSHSYDPDLGEFTFTFTIPNDLSAVTMSIVTTDDLSDPVVWTAQEMTLESSDSSTETWSATVALGPLGFGRLVVETYSP